MMASRNLEQLPAELIVLIASHVDSPNDLATFSTISRRIHQTCQEAWNPILRAVLKNAFAENWALAIAACEASETSRIWWTKRSTKSVAQSHRRIIQVLTESVQSATSTEAADEQATPLLGLSKIWQITEFFLSEFKLSAFRFATSKLSLAKEQYARSRETSGERSRIQRALLLFEIYRRIMPTIVFFEPLQLGGASAAREEIDQATQYLQLFPPWDREAILSVQEFLVLFVQDIYERAGNWFVLEVCAMARDYIAAKPRDQQGMHDAAEVRQLAMQLETGAPYVFDETRLDPEIMLQYWVARGLPFLKFLDKLPPREQCYTLNAYRGGRCPLSVFTALWLQQRELGVADSKRSWPLDSSARISSDHPGGPGWAWAERHGLTDGHECLLRRYELRRMGYVFWDTARLDGDWKLLSRSPNALELQKRREDDYDGEFFMNREIEKRLGDTPVATGTFSALYCFDRQEPPEEWLCKLDDDGYYPLPFSEEERREFDIEY